MQIKKYRSGLLIIVYIAFGIYCFVLGDNGILERIKLVKGKQVIADSIDRLKNENRKLQNEYAVIGNTGLNKEIYKREASDSGFISSDEKYIFFKGENQPEAKKTTAVENDKYPVKLHHLRILWGIGSIMVILLYLARKRKVKEEY